MSEKPKETLIPLYPKTDFQKLLFAEKYIDLLKNQVKNLKKENGKLKSEIDYYENINKKAKKVKEQRDQIKGLIGRNKKLKRDNRELVEKIIKLKQNE